MAQIQQNQMKSFQFGSSKTLASMFIQKELEDMQSNPSDDFKCLALKENLYDWQFAIRGPNGTEFEGGIYHGRIQFPEEFPNKPPIFTLLTENGRFKTQTEIKVGHSFSRQFRVRNALLRLIELLPTYPDGALGSVEYNKEEMRALAIKSRIAAPIYGTAERQKLIDQIHEYMLSKVPPVWASSQNDQDKRKWAERIHILVQIQRNQMESFSSMLVEKYKKFKSRKKLASSYIQTELEEMQSNPSNDFKCLSLTENPYDWQFAIRGPNGTEFEGGIYHGRIQFSEEYPHKPPIIMLLTENGRFKTQTEINFYQIFWEPFGVRDALHRLIELLPTYPDGALGSVEYDKEERRALAIKSREAAPRYGTAERQKLIDEIHEYMKSKVLVPSNGGGDIRVSSQNDRDRRKQDIVTKKRKRKQDINIFYKNTIKADSCKQVGFFDIGKRVKSLWWWS